VAISVLEVRDTCVPSHVRVPAAVSGPVPVPGGVVTSTADTVRGIPATVVAAALVGVLEAVGILAVALTGLDRLLTSVGRPAGWLIAAGILLLAAWIVLCAGGAAGLLDRTGRSLLVGVAYVEMSLVGILLVVATVTPVPHPTSLPVPALGLLALAVPVGKLLLAGAPSAQRWVARGPRRRSRRPDPVRAHRTLATLTLGAIGALLCAVAVLAPVPADAADDPASAVSPHP
jgi:hypothetical protein